MNDIFIVPLDNSNQICLIDSNDSARVLKYNWRLRPDGYIETPNKNFGLRYLHRFVINCPKGYDVHHKNPRFDNRKESLVPVKRGIHSHLHQNTRVKEGTSKYVGVYWCKRTSSWRAQIKTKGKNIGLGRFDFEIDAAITWDRNARFLYKDSAQTNFNIT